MNKIGVEPGVQEFFRLVTLLRFPSLEKCETIQLKSITDTQFS